MMFMKDRKYIDNTQPCCWGYRPEPEKHDAFVGWRTIFERINGKPRLDYVPGRGSCRGFSDECDRLVRWWSKGRDCPEKWWLAKCAGSRGPSVREETVKDGKFLAIVERSDEYVYVSLYFDRDKKGV